MEGDMERLSLITLNEEELRICEETLIKKVKEEDYDEALRLANKIVACGIGNPLAYEIQKLLVEKIQLDQEEDSSSEYSTSSSDNSSEDDGEGSSSASSEDSVDESETLWGKMDSPRKKPEDQGSGAPSQGEGAREGAEVRSRPRPPVMSKQERTTLKSKLMSDLVQLKQQSPYKK